LLFCCVMLFRYDTDDTKKNSHGHVHCLRIRLQCDYEST
jgi:hypothetical protein